ncbi:MAG: hypothetical protein CLLPBCKN_003343 [Chroococcidiopsis cubana SAG 39.79]|uniref:Prepilin-type N-terminal cleavage/methylation domain-containing protein n=1 Tax=Chroococcidiopsis cubana SAG 39.79 TaxID=388085 RepID=A0AB37UAF3_9CYAN|nr:hypothetical protein [Chroococcidiopsis cubana]MDZ4873947.1 hypothetical protein [Chroococcidiopsis cubana SAG 39.79]PSB64832.1 hypothetical protein C7B79_08105 [Chroococcidiopsis cubana CCALA 043]RUT02314.1 prepilin-type N-terminal cleavage/methylation domain-containing protein [Chroococcidiopsis cubana SAG 39.79]
MLKKKPLKLEQGFTVIEALFAILIATIFVTVAMQMMAIAAIFKARAQQNAEATTWIQEDLENVKLQATELNIKNVDSMTASTDRVTITSHGYSNGNTVIFQGTGTIAGGIEQSRTYYVRDVATDTFKLASSSSGAAIDLTSDSTGDLTSIATAKCAGNSATDGYADSLRDSINGDSASTNNTSKTFSKTSTLTSQQFNLARSTIPNSDDYKSLKISYTVTPASGGKSIASFYTEVIPNAALYCPTN